MTEFNVILQKTRFTEMIIEAKDEKEAGQKAMAIYEDGNADWGDEDVEIKETEKI